MPKQLFIITELSLHQQLEILTYGRDIKEDLQELAQHLRTTAPDRITFAQKQLKVLGQCPEFYEAWKKSLRSWNKALRLSDPGYNLYL